MAVIPAACASGASDDTPSKYEVQAVCEEWVKKQLKAPGTAKFSDHATSGGPISWTVTGSVDAENSFGALLRSSWTCDIRLDGDTWRGSARILG